MKPIHANRWRSVAGPFGIGALFALCVGTAQAATCVWNSANGDWSTPANWTGCADAPGPSTRSPALDDTAVVVDGIANLAASPTVAELELGSNGELHVVGSTRTLTVTTALRLNGGRTSTVLGTNQLHLLLDAGANGSLLASSSLEDATFLMNSGNLALGSDNGASLNLKVAAQLQNLAGGTVTMTGADSRLYLESSAQVINEVGATFAISGNAQIGKPVPAAGPRTFRNLGSMSLTGPGSLSFPGGGGGFVEFHQQGALTVSNADLDCDQVASLCRFFAGDGTDSVAPTHLDNGRIDLGGAGAELTLSPGASLGGSGEIDGTLLVNGTLAPGAASGPPYGVLAISGGVRIRTSGRLDVDIGGSAAASHDALQLGAALDVSGSIDGIGTLQLRLAPGYAPALGAAVPVVGYASVVNGAGFNRIEANYPLDYATRFDPTALDVFPAPRLTVEDASLIEGNVGDTQMQFAIRLSQPSSQEITVSELRASAGTATEGVTFDFNAGVQSFTFAPGETLKHALATIHGDVLAEADEAFSLELRRSGNLVNAAYGNGVRGRLVASGTIVSDDLPPGTRFVLVGMDAGADKIRRYTHTGTFIDAWDTIMPIMQNNIVTGLCFSPDGKVLATRFGYRSPILYSRHGAMLDSDFGFVTSSSPGFHQHESCVYDRSGNAYIGQAGATDTLPDSEVPILKFSESGVLLERFVIPTGERGTDWIELAGDQCTLYYTSEDTAVRRYNLCTHSVLPIFTSSLGGPHCYALRLRPNRELMVACQDAVHRLNQQGAIVQTYTRQSIGENDAGGLFALNLDPDGTSFWTAGVDSGMVYRVDIESGAVLTAFNSGTGGVSGLAVYGEIGDDSIFADGFEAPPPPPPAPKSALPCAKHLIAAGDAFPHHIPGWLHEALNGDCAGNVAR